MFFFALLCLNIDFPAYCLFRDCASAEVTGVPTAMVHGVPTLATGIHCMKVAIAEKKAAKIII